MDLVQVNPLFNLYDPDWPLRTYQPQMPPAKFVFAQEERRGQALDSIVSMGCIISGGLVERSILCPGVRINSYARVQDSILMPNVTVHRHSRVRRAIVDRDVVIPAGSIIGFDPDEDRRRHTVSESGIVVVTPGEECKVDRKHAPDMPPTTES
jgi:glucose-1-phosphate adenylyltransferase